MAPGLVGCLQLIGALCRCKVIDRRALTLAGTLVVVGDLLWLDFEPFFARQFERLCSTHMQRQLSAAEQAVVQDLLDQ